MEEFCKNCGAKITENTNFCPDCGSKVENKQKIEPGNFCQQCGKKLAPDEDFCSECGTNLKTPHTNESFIKKYKIPIIIGVLVIIIIIIGLLVLGSTSNEDTYVDLPATTVTVGAEYFELPGQFALNAGPLDIDSQNGVSSFSQTFTYGNEGISIAVMSSYQNLDLDSVIESQGGVRKTLMGHDGYYNEYDIDDYSFAFVLDNKVCVIETTSPYLFDKITVL